MRASVALAAQWSEERGDGTVLLPLTDIKPNNKQDEFAPKATLKQAVVWKMFARLDGVDTDGSVTWYEEKWIRGSRTALTR